MPAVNVIDELFMVAAPESVRAAVCDARRWAEWLPGIVLAPYQDRGRLGVRWAVSGDLTGTAEVWLEEHGDGTIVHAYLRAEAPGGETGRSRRLRHRVAARCALALKRALFQVKDELEGSREPGSARVPLSERVVSASDSGRVRRSKGAAETDGRPDHLEHPDLG